MPTGFHGFPRVFYGFPRVFHGFSTGSISQNMVFSLKHYVLDPVEQKHDAFQQAQQIHRFLDLQDI